MVEPGPSAEELREIVRIGSRTPDHGKLAPWRFIHIPKSARPEFGDLLHRAYARINPEPTRAELEAVNRLAHQAPCLIAVIFSPIVGSKIPLWEQELSCGAACMNLLHATHALGYTGGWITGWSVYSEEVRRAFTKSDDERLAGLIYIGTPAHELEERPRPLLEYILSDWPALRP